MQHVLPCLLSPQPPVFPASAESGLQTHTDHNPLSLTSHGRIKDKEGCNCGCQRGDGQQGQGDEQGEDMSTWAGAGCSALPPAPAFLAQREGRARQKAHWGGMEGLWGYNPQKLGQNGNWGRYNVCKPLISTASVQGRHTVSLPHIHAHFSLWQHSGNSHRRTTYNMRAL